MGTGGIPSTRELIRELRDQNWRVEQTGNGHYKAFAPDGCNLITFSETGEPRAMKNNLADLRRTGQFEWPPPDRRTGRNGSSGAETEATPVAVTDGTPGAPVQPTMPVQPTPQPALDLDSLFRNLKDARSELFATQTKHEDVVTEVRLAELALAEAKDRARRSQEEIDVARRLVTEAKAEFDAAFDGGAA